MTEQPPFDEASAPANTEFTWASLWRALQTFWRRLGEVTFDRRVAWGLLVAILLLGAILRFTGLDWDEGQHLHPDERFLTMVENSLRWPKSLKEYFDTSINPLNPYNHNHGTYVYGLSPVVLAKFLGQISGKTGYGGVYLAGRAMSGGMDLLSILLVFLIGRRLYDARAGLLGALFLALSVLNIQQSHYFTVDATMTFFVTLALYFAVRVAQGEGWGSILMLGVSFGLAVSAKISVLTFLLIIGLAYLLRALPAWQREQAEGSPVMVDRRGRWGRFWYQFRLEADPACAPSPSDRLIWPVVRAGFSLLVVLVVAVLVFRTVQPQAFTGPGFFNFKLNPHWLEDMKNIQRLVSGEADYPPSHQWTAREPWYMLKNMVLWGLGVPLGVLVWIAWAIMAYELYRHHKWAHLLPWVWMTMTFVYQSIQFVKTIRYLLPIYPTMAVMAGYGLVWLWERAKEQAARGGGWWRRWLRPAVTVLALVIILGTAFWALAFTSIYTRPVTRIAASRWMYANLPQGASISNELWDDPLPLNVDGRLASAQFRQIQMDPYAEDDNAKRQRFYSWLEQIDYICLSSNRLYESIPRLPSRYPMTTRYYQALFSGELGYELIQTFTSRPRLFGIEINDDGADESFTVYDHPKVLLFKKRDDFSLDKVRALFEGYDLERIVRIRPLQVTQAPNNLMLTEDEAVIQRQGGTWSKIFRRDDLANRLPTLVWLFALEVLGWVAFPLGFVAFRRLRDRGYILAKTLGLLLLAYIPWLLASLKLAPYTRGTILGTLVGLAFLAAAVAWVQRRALAAYLRARWRLLLVNEALFLCFFLAFWLIRWANPDLWHPVTGGEKPMDLAYLNAIIKSTYFPPYDPWFAGGYINYYYWGFVVVATFIKLTGIVPTVAYNLAIPTWFALTAMGACTVAFNLIPAGEDEAGWWPRALRFGVVGALLVAVVGNLGEVKLLLGGLQELGKNVALRSAIPGLAKLVQALAGLGALLFKGQRLPFRSEWWYWNASRIMQHGEINEFPFFTFLYADLHAHLTAMPFALLALGLVTSLVARPVEALARLARDEDVRPPLPTPTGIGQRFLARWRTWNWALVWQLTLLGLVLGELWCNNTWDFPTYTGIALVALAIAVWEEHRRVDQRSLTQLVLRAGYVLVLALLLFRPYHAHFGSAYSSVQPWKGERTDLGSYLLIHATPLFILTSYLLSLAFARDTRNGLARALRLFLRQGGRRRRAWHLYNLLVRCQTAGYELGWAGLVFLGAICLALAAAKAWVTLLGLPLLVLAIALTCERRATPERRLQTLWVAVGLALTLAVEYVVLKGDIGRMNTVFKFYLQVWILWGIVSAVALAYLWPRRLAWPRTPRQLWQTVLTLLLIGVSLYPIFATYGKVRDRWDPSLPGGLDGTHYMTTARYHDNNRELVLEHDRQAILWIQDHIQGSPVIAEANTPLYRWGNRISIYTGLPTIIGWDWHQKQQRAAVSGIVVDWRLQDLRDLYNTQDWAVARKIIDRYHVSYIYVGELERAYYDAKGLAKFDAMVGSALEVVYQRGPVTIYRVIGSEGKEAGAWQRPAPSQEDEQTAHASRPGLLDWLTRHWLVGPVRAEGPEKPEGDAPQPEGKTLLLDEPVDQLPVVNGRGWNPLARTSTLGAILCWWLVLELVGLAAWPLAAKALPLADGGYALAKGLGLLIVGYLVWIGASLRLAANSPPIAWAALALLGACAFFLWSRRRPEAMANWQQLRRLVFIEEGLFTLAFLAFVGLRLLNPDLWQPWFGGEKMMEIAILNALNKSAYMPPYDPYFAGGYLNYYYYGQFLATLLVKLSGVHPEVGFNLAVPTFFALTIAHAFAVGYQLGVWGLGYGVRRRNPSPQGGDDLSPSPLWGEGWGEGHSHAAFPPHPIPLPLGEREKRGFLAGLGAAAAVAILANLTGALQVLEQLARAGGATFPNYRVVWADLPKVFVGMYRLLAGQAQWPGFDYWYRATRVIPYTINEFPFFSFLFADLHPHLIGIPFTILAVALSLASLGGEDESIPRQALRWLLLALAVGALGAINTWDLPTYLAIAGGVLAYRGCQRGRKGSSEAAVSFLLLALVALLLYAPFYAHYQAQYVGLAPVPSGERSPLAPFLAIWGFWLFWAFSQIAIWGQETWPLRRLMRLVARWGWERARRWAWACHDRRWTFWGLGALLLAASLALAMGLLGHAEWVLAFTVPPALVVGALLLGGRTDEATFFRRLLILLALGILAGCEIVYLKDFLAGSEWRRMNTLFKFGIQAWVLLGLALGSGLPRLWGKVAAWRPWARVPWRAIFGFLAAAALVYPVFAIPARVNERFPGCPAPRWTLDGTAYMETARYHWPDEAHVIELRYDREAIRWLWEHVRGTPVLAEAPLGFYREGGLRVSSYTGLPTLLGAHEPEQRPWEQVSPREQDAIALYTTTDTAAWEAIVRRHRVRYIYVGQLERIVYAGPGLDKFEALVQNGHLARVFHNERVDIYEVKGETP